MRKIALLAAISVLAVSLPTFQADAKNIKRGASAYAPGQLAKKPNALAARNYAPGQLAKRPNAQPAKYYAPGRQPQPSITGTTGVRVR